jgi:hypothetical protein
MIEFLVDPNIPILARSFTTDVKVDIFWRLVFSAAAPYIPLLTSDVLEFRVMGAWLLAHISRTG